MGSMDSLGIGVHELRRDRSFSTFLNLFRVYLDNFDQLQRVDKKLAHVLAGTTSPLVEQIRESYESQRLPRHAKKSVQQQLQAEVQGACGRGPGNSLCQAV